MSSKILSTKKLTLAQRELALNGKLRIVEYDAIQIEYAPFQIEGNFDYYIFTSQNAVKSYLNIYRNHFTPIREEIEVRAFCVGSKTKSLLEQNGVEVLEAAVNAETLAQNILKNHRESSFLFLSGNLRRNTLPELFIKNNIRYNEIEVYKTALRPKKFENRFDGILFFSPSGVQSFMQVNELSKTTAFCIGETTLAEAKKYTNQFIKANKPTIENVIVQAVKHYSR